MGLYAARRQADIQGMFYGREAALLKGHVTEPEPELYGCGLIPPDSPMLLDPTMRFVASVVAITPDGRVIRGVMSTPPGLLRRVRSDGG
jgi:hypothetical protein